MLAPLIILSQGYLEAARNTEGPLKRLKSVLGRYMWGVVDKFVHNCG